MCIYCQSAQFKLKEEEEEETAHKKPDLSSINKLIVVPHLSINSTSVQFKARND
jgi:hypothetical protein